MKFGLERGTHYVERIPTAFCPLSAGSAGWKIKKPKSYSTHHKLDLTFEWVVQTVPSSKEGSIADEPRKKKNRKQRYRENKALPPSFLFRVAYLVVNITGCQCHEWSSAAVSDVAWAHRFPASTL